MQPEKIVKPLFKYIGGKSWLRDDLRQAVSLALNEGVIEAYAEPFAGGLGSFLAVNDLLEAGGVKKVFLSDINFSLINVYKAIASKPKELIDAVILLEKGFSHTFLKTWNDDKNKLVVKEHLKAANDYFKAIKKNFNANKTFSDVEQSARLIFLQKHSFNGIYRENQKGEYNTPFNWSGSTMEDSIEERINELNRIFAVFDIEFKTSSFTEMVYQKSGVLYYLDPPYLNESTAENKYNKDAFAMKEQCELIDKINGCKFIYSNHYSEVLIKRLKENVGLQVKKVSRKNVISASVESRKVDVEEMLATNI